MYSRKNIAFLPLIILAFFLLLSPCQATSFSSLNIFYSNDVAGQTEPCG